MVEASGPAAEVSALISELRPLLEQLKEMIAEQVADPTTGTMGHHKVTGSPAPWHREAGPLLMTIHAGVRELELDLKWRVSGRLGPARGGSDANTLAALDSIARLVFGVPEDVARGVRRQLDRWIEQAWQIRDVGLAERWVPIHVPHGQLPPSCPYCRTYSLRVAQESGRVRCSNPPCKDTEGNRPAGRIDKNRMDGSAMLAWADGRTIDYSQEPA